MKYIILLCWLILSGISNKIVAQQPRWQWAKSGGAISSPQVSGVLENVTSMATDGRGNLYATVYMGHDNIVIDGHAMTLPGFSGDGMAVVSWNCAGQYRWSKLMAVGAFVHPLTISVDSIGGVYVLGRVLFHQSSSIQILTDTALTLSNQHMVLMKFDTAGTYQWIRTLESGTNSQPNLTKPLDLTVEANGMTHLLTRLDTGTYAQGQLTVTNPGVFILKYDAQGQYNSVVNLQIGINPQGLESDLSFTRHPTSGKYFFSSGGVNTSGGANTINPIKYTFNGTTPTKSIHIAAFSPQGNLLWFKENGTLSATITRRPVVDSQCNVYIAGVTVSGDNFQTHYFSNSGTYGNGFPFIVKMDSIGQMVWVKAAQTQNASVSAIDLAYSNGIIGMCGNMPSMLYGGGNPSNATLTFDTFQRVCPNPRSRTDLYLVRLDAQTGTVLSLDTSAHPYTFYTVSAATIAADQKGNFFVGGYFDLEGSFGPYTVYNPYSVYSPIYGIPVEWMVAKLGRPNCFCSSPPPSPTFSSVSQNAGSTYEFAFTGSTTGLDSVVWSFGDGQKRTLIRQKDSTISHNYYRSDTFRVCIAAYNGCGSTQTCQIFTVTALGVENHSNSPSTADIQIAPNPAHNLLQIHLNKPHKGKLEIIDGTGRLIAVQSLPISNGSWDLVTTNWASGIYQVLLKEEGKILAREKISITH